MATAHAIPHPGIQEAHHEDVGFWRTYVFSTDHKIIGIQYAVTALFFLMFGFCLMLMMRWQIAIRGNPCRWWVGCWNGFYTIPEVPAWRQRHHHGRSIQYFGAMHGTIMVFMAIVPLAFAAFGKFS